jgi:hyperosmotically inducible protein
MALIVGLLISACAGPKEKTAGDVVDDTWIHTKVKSVLSTNRGASINIEVYKGEVQLAGFTTDPGLRKSLPDHASRVSGVKKVYNQIIVVDSGRSAGEALDDGLVVTRVNGALADTSLDEAIKINVESNRGKVLLSGFIDSEEQRREALATAKGVSGVKDVIDGMTRKWDK